MKLFVDDERSAPNSSWQVARTVHEAIRLISMFDFSDISLDHDDGHDSFEAVAHYICAKYSIPEQVGEWMSHFPVDTDEIEELNVASPTLTIHSANPVGAKKMLDLFSTAGFQCSRVDYLSLK